MKKIRVAMYALLVAIIFMAPVPMALAVPSSSAVRTFSQPDGATFEGRVRGDELFHYTVTKDGKLIQKDKAGVWHFLKSGDSGLSFSGRADKIASAEDISADVLLDDAMKQAYIGLVGDKYVAWSRRVDEPITLEKVRKTQRMRAKSEPGIKKAGMTGSIPLVMIVIGFNNCPYSDEYNWAEKAFTGKYSVASYYKDMSDDRFTFVPAKETSKYGADGNTNVSDVENDGIIHVNLNIDHKDWSGIFYNTEYCNGFWDCLRMTLEEASPYIDFSSYDADKNGSVDRSELGICYAFAGYDAAFDLSSVGDNALELSIWPHQYSITDDSADAPEIDGVKVNYYIAIAEKCVVGPFRDVEIRQETVGTLIHELGHILGLPDLYETEEKDDTMGWGPYIVKFFSPMANGCDLYNPEAGDLLPDSLDAWSKFYLGWTKTTVVRSSQSIDLNSDSTGKYNTVLVENLSSKNPDEFFLLENRYFEKWDSSLLRYVPGFEGGIIVWHIDDGIIRNDFFGPNNKDHRPGVMPLFVEKSQSGYFSGPVSSWEIGEEGFPLFTKDYPSVEDLPYIPFVLYGTGADADLRSARTCANSGFKVLSGAGKTMKVDITVPSIMASAAFETLFFGQSATITKVSSSISDDVFGAVENSDSSVVDAKVSSGKLIVTGKRKAGEATLTIVSEKGAKAIVKVQVKKGTVAKLKKTSGKVRVKKSLKIVSKKGSFKGDRIYSCKSSNVKVAKVTGSGKVTGVKKGKAVITVTMLSGATRKFKVSVV